MLGVLALIGVLSVEVLSGIAMSRTLYQAMQITNNVCR